MKISALKKQSRKIIKGRVKSSTGFLLFLLTGIVLFSLLPFLVDLFLGKKEAAALPLLVVIFMMGICWFSSFRMGSGTWFLFYNKKRRGAKAAYWMKPTKSVGCARLYFSLFCRKILWTLIFLSPGATVAAGAIITAMSGGIEFNLFVTFLAGGTALMLTGAVFLYIFLQRYFLVPYLKAVSPSMKNREIIRKSRDYMSDRIKKAAMLKISFLPWIVLSFTIIPSFYVWTYYSQSCALMASRIYTEHTSAEKITDTES